MGKQVQVIMDSVFSFAGLGIQQFETSRHLSCALRDRGFRIETASRASR